MEINGEKIYEMIAGIKDDVSELNSNLRKEMSDLKLNSQKDMSELHTKFAVMQYSQDQTMKDVATLKVDIADIKQKNASFDGEKKKGSNIMNRLWPIILLILTPFISFVTTNLTIKPLVTAQIQQVQNQQIVPTPTQH